MRQMYKGLPKKSHSFQKMTTILLHDIDKDGIKLRIYDDDVKDFIPYDVPLTDSVDEMYGKLKLVIEEFRRDINENKIKKFLEGVKGRAKLLETKSPTQYVKLRQEFGWKPLSVEF